MKEKYDLLKLIPRDAEMGLVGAALINPAVLWSVDVEPADFGLHSHGYVWAAMLALKERGMDIDLVTVSDELRKQGKLDEVGGPAFLTKLVSNVPSSLHGESYARDIRLYARRRRLIYLSEYIHTFATDPRSDVDEEISRVISKLSDTSVADRKSAHVSDWAEEGAELIMEWRENPPVVLSTGMKEVDQVIGGFHAGGVVLVGGKPSAGKSILVQNIVASLAGKQGIPGAFYTLEMSKRQMFMRLLSAETRIPVSRLQTGDVDNTEAEIIRKDSRRIGSWPLHVSDERWTTSQLQADLARLQAKQGIQWFAIDYLERLTDRVHTESKWERTEIIGRRLIEMSKELNLPGIVVQKLNKGGWAGLADMEDFSGGGDLAYDAVSMVILGPHTPESGPEDENMRTLVSVKPNRLTEQWRHSCHVYKEPTIPVMGPVTYRYGVS